MKKRRPTQPKTGNALTVEDVIAWLKKKGTKKQIGELDRYGITASHPFGVSVGELRKFAKTIGTDHRLAEQLWATGRYEAQMLAAIVDDPGQVTIRQMNAWAADFDNWAIVDTVCFQLFDRTKHAWTQVPRWVRAKPEFKKRAAFALLWSLSTHDKLASNEAFLGGLKIIETHADDERHFVKKAANMALRAIGKRNKLLHRAAIQTAERLALSENAAAQWTGKHAVRELKSPKVKSRIKQ